MVNSLYEKYLLYVKRSKLLLATVLVLIIGLLIFNYFKVSNYNFALLNIFLLPNIILFRNINPKSEFYHLITGNDYSKILISKTLAVATYLNIIYFIYLIIVLVNNSFIFNLENIIINFLLFNIFLFLAFLLGDIIHYSDINTVSNFWKKMLKHILFYIFFGISYSFVIIANTLNFSLLYNSIILIVLLFIWYINCKRYKIIYFKNVIIPNIYDLG